MAQCVRNESAFEGRAETVPKVEMETTKTAAEGGSMKCAVAYAHASDVYACIRESFADLQTRGVRCNFDGNFIEESAPWLRDRPRGQQPPRRDLSEPSGEQCTASKAKRAMRRSCTQENNKEPSGV